MKTLLTLAMMSLLTILSSCSHPKAALSEQLLTGSDWQLRKTNSDTVYKAVVPGNVHSDLLRNNAIPDPYYRTNERSLQWIDKVDWEYSRTFDVDDALFRRSAINLVFKGLDTYADVYLNDQPILKTDNMFLEWVVDVKPLLQSKGNRIKVVFQSPIKRGLHEMETYGILLPAVNDQAVNGGLTVQQCVSPYVRKAPYHFGWDWGPRFVTSGIWQPIVLRGFDDFRIQDIQVVQLAVSKEKASVTARLNVWAATALDNVQLAVTDGSQTLATKSVALAKGPNTVELPFDIQSPKLWWTNGLGESHLYNFRFAVSHNGCIDTQTVATGLRSLKLVQKPDSAGNSFYFELNGNPLFVKGANHIPNDMFLDRVTPQVLEAEVGAAAEANINMIRVWGGGIYEDDYFYHLCDQKGILVWQDFMFACSMYPGNREFLESITAEADYQIKRLRNHACLALWCGNNEIDVAWKQYDENGGWGWKKNYTQPQRDTIWKAYQDIFNGLLPKKVTELNPQTAYWHSSPASNLAQQHANDQNPTGDVHYWGVWWGKHPFERYAEFIGRFMSEYGFQSFPELESVKKYAIEEDFDIDSDVMKAHQRSSIGNVTIREYMDMYYKTPSSFADFLYVGQVLQAEGIRFAIESHRLAMPYNMGSIYWQINDCWPVASWSSMDYYRNWKALHYQIKRSFAPVLPMVKVNGGDLEMKVASDRLSAFNATLQAQWIDFDGRVQWTKAWETSIGANGITSVAIVHQHDLEQKGPQNASLLRLTVLEGGNAIAQRNVYLVKPKDLKLAKPHVSATLLPQGNTCSLTLKTDKLAKDVFVSVPGLQMHFSDNYFDLLPGDDVTVEVTGNGAQNLTVDQLKIMTLADTY